jgi:hypothetical protein
MAFKDTVRTMRELLVEIQADLTKGENGNKAAAQRVRVYTIDLEKIAKLYRKESIQSEKKGGKKAAPKKAAPTKPVSKRATAKVPKRKR